MENSKLLLGTGWKFPPTFNLYSGKVMMVSEEEDIRESLELLFSTRRGERNMLPEYGCDLHKVIFDTITENSVSHLRNIISEAIYKFEPRITFNKIEVDADKQAEGFITILVYFIINNTNKSSSIAYHIAV